MMHAYFQNAKIVYIFERDKELAKAPRKYE